MSDAEEEEGEGGELTGAGRHCRRHGHGGNSRGDEHRQNEDNARDNIHICV